MKIRRNDKIYTAEEVKNWLPLLTAYAEGKTIQGSVLDVNGHMIWYDLGVFTSSMLKGSTMYYRVKPE